MYRGVSTGLNEAFVINRVTRAAFIAEDPRSEELIKPFLRGRDMKRWRFDFADQYLLLIPYGETLKLLGYASDNIKSSQEEV